MQQKIQNLIKKVVTEFIYGGHLLSIGGAGIVFTVILLMRLPVTLLALIIPYLSSQVVYTYNHFREIDFDADSNPERASHMRKQHNSIAMILFGYVVVLLGLTLLTNLYTFIFVVIVVICGILYTEYFKGLTVGYLAGFKNFYTSFFWASTVLLVPLLYKVPTSVILLYIFFFVFLRWIVNSAFFDIKDIDSDSKRGLKTFAVVFGKRKAVYLLQLINLVSIVPLLIGIYNGVIGQFAVVLAILPFYGFYYLTKSLFIQGKELRTLSYIVVDAEYIFWPIIVLIGLYFIK